MHNYFKCDNHIHTTTSMLWQYYAMGMASLSSVCRYNGYIVMAKFPIPENCSAYVPLILKEFCSSEINGLVIKNFFREIVTL
jgi:hypothetical protein